ncbi:Putative Free Met sulfoxide reductase, GAF domain, GAF-like domain superfamily [Septoria linicola]|uniref:Free Met sulfoxide reductase, GAF domain, GAF-like domain superfamily n=1 Tax=Septoria linicola TaxID=215465 RepID=A0A9Q9AJC0_9PEZI|nr:putative Free Met sulfoxide reductase, GAF domain, GAF-like domain superfamily [Septoria linicola]USW47218.1 Putative Free Met sulfoxide reductase, GAF domain, GAF-like domain superfamily [Septoria linicola]
MVHADSSNFVSGVSKTQAYDQVIEQATALFAGQRNWLRSNTANAASLLWHAYHALQEPSNKVNWAGFYTLDHTTREQLILGPFHGKVACQTIKFGKGVCGAAAASLKTQLVPDVEQFPGHIACDGDSRSEVVVPIVKHGKVVAIIDIDCAVVNGFDEEDKVKLEQLAQLLADACDW